MAHPELRDHPKFLKAMRLTGLPAPHLLGHLEFLWMRGYQLGTAFIGDSDDIEAAAEFNGERGSLTLALAMVRLIDDNGDGTYSIHDLYEHAPDYAKKRMERRGNRPEDYAGGTRSYGADSGGSRRQTAEVGDKRRKSATNGGSRRQTAEVGDKRRVEGEGKGKIEEIKDPLPPKGVSTDEFQNDEIQSDEKQNEYPTEGNPYFGPPPESRDRKRPPDPTRKPFEPTADPIEPVVDFGDLVERWVSAKLPGHDSPGGIRPSANRRQMFQFRLRDPTWCSEWRSAIDRLAISSKARGLDPRFPRGVRLDDFLQKEDYVARILEGEFDDPTATQTIQARGSPKPSIDDIVQRAAAEHAARKGGCK